jgi:hypothetical protein
MSSEKPIADAAEGVTKAVLGFSKEQLEDYIGKFRNRELAFLSDPEIIKIAKEQRSTSEWNLFTQIIDKDDHYLRILFQMGLTLRKLQGKKERLESLRENILKKYDAKGLHIAQLIQNGFFNRFLANALERNPVPQQLKFELKNLLDNIENTVVFVQERDNVNNRVEEITIKLLANSPKTFMICGQGFARDKVDAIMEQIKKWIHQHAIEYEYEIYQSKYREVIFLNKSEEQST